jgi:hypothetical protein
MMEQVDYSKLVFKHVAAVTCTPTVHREAYTRLQRPLLQVHQRRTQLSWLCRDGHSGSTSTMQYAVITHHTAARALPRLCRAPPLDFSSVSHTGSPRVPGHAVSPLDSSPGHVRRRDMALRP